ncbi:MULTISPECIES: sigma-70 family RNA polymerase sigma factor [Natronospira]|uniref:Sigma-70 family RNA polymerase sigma factor n=2 Tax=Natronospira TaxID=2024969 RepID=A0AAP6JHP9_9GAMM|nr:sigma-70 family RNA polymerase sigma factor [Natronospira sp. AB-CW4]MDQ2068634.1 sigma-70 family RNA polymerase sigma factor [Natronospira sp. AB-CW4]MEA5446464.1 sigma-70 family RNA polymerase sigma factor [Gammaproteobacteria bacterium AB-CW1]
MSDESRKQTDRSRAASRELAAAYPRFREGLLAFLRSKLSEPVVAEDLLHEVFLKALDALDRGARPSNLPAWLRTIAANALTDHYRRARPTEALPVDLADDGPGHNQAEQEMAACLIPFINGLPPKYRQVMYATTLEGKSGAQLSRELGLTPSAIKSRMARGRAMLREAILDCCHIEASANGEVLEYRRRFGKP